MQGLGLCLLTVLSFFPEFFHIEEILFFSLLGLAILAGWLEENSLRIRTPIDLPLLLLLAWILLTIPFSSNPEYSFGEWRKLVVQVLVFYWSVYVIREASREQQEKSRSVSFRWLEWIREKSPSQNVFLGVLIGTVLLSVIALVDFLNRGGNWQDRNVRAIVPGSDYNWLSTYLVLTLPVVVYCGLTAKLLWKKIFSTAVFVLALFANVASYSRAGWLASVAQVFSFGLVTQRRVLLIVLILAVLLVPFAVMGIAQMGYQADTLDTWTIKTRIRIWNLGVEQIINHPIVGIGYGNNNFQPVLVDSPMGDVPMHLHNTPLMFGVGSGIPGILLFLWIFIRMGQEFFVVKNQKSWTDTEILKLCLGIVLVGFFCRNLFDYMFSGSVAYLFWILMACGLALARGSQVLQGWPGRLPPSRGDYS